MKTGLQLLLILLFYSFTASSQVNRFGTPLISWFDAAQAPGELRNLCITMDSCGVMYFGNEGGGIVTYDGSRWDLLGTSGTTAVTTLVTDTRGVIFAGGRNDFGMLLPDEAGRMTYRSLTGMIPDPQQAASVGTIISSAADSNNVWLTDGKRLYRLGNEIDSVDVTDLESGFGIGNVSALVSFGNRIILADREKGLFAYENGNITPLAGAEAGVPANFVKLLQYDRESILIGATGKDLMLFNVRTGVLTEQFSDRAASGMMKNGILTDLAILPGNMIAAGFAGRGGIYVFSRDGRLLQRISERTTELQESSVTAMYCDYASNSQLWFCTAGFINRAYVSLPASGFSRASGITSVAGSILGFEGSVYAGTDNGLFVDYTDGSGTRRFRRSGDYPDPVNELIEADLAQGSYMIAATGDGLLQLDENHDEEHFLPGISFTAISQSGEERDVFIAGSDDGVIRKLRYDGYDWNELHALSLEADRPVRDIRYHSPGEWWVLTEDPRLVIRMDCEKTDTTFYTYGPEKGVLCDTINGLELFNGELYLCTGRGIYRYNTADDAFVRDHDLIGSSFDDVSISRLSMTPDGEIFLSGFDTRNFDALVTVTSQGHVVFRRQFDFLPDIATTGTAFAEGTIWLAKGHSLFVIDKSKLAFRYGAFRTVFTRIISGKNTVLMDGTFSNRLNDGTRIPSPVQPSNPEITLLHRDNSISFRWTTTSYVEEEKTEYRHRLEGFDDDWSGWERRNYRDYTNLPSGDYRFVLRAKTITGLEGEELIYSFSVRKPWYGSAVALIVYGTVTGWLLFVVIRYLAKRLRRRNRRYENLLKQRNEAAAKGINVISEIEKYAAMVQKAILPSEKNLADAINNSFLLNRPGGAISGDFLWVRHTNERTLVAVGDCPGHDVLSSLRTLTAIRFLEVTADSQPSMKTSELLNEFRNRISAAFIAASPKDIHHEGIDLSLLVIDRHANTIGFSGAATQCFRVRVMSDQEKARWDNGEFKPNEGTMASGKYLLETVYGDRIPLGMHFEGDYLFTQHTWKLEKGSSYYLFTDGYADQFNGVTGKKFLKKNLRRLILDIQNFHMSKQKEILEERLVTWMGNAPQTDDILVAGLRID